MVKWQSLLIKTKTLVYIMILLLFIIPSYLGFLTLRLKIPILVNLSLLTPDCNNGIGNINCLVIAMVSRFTILVIIEL